MASGLVMGWPDSFNEQGINGFPQATVFPNQSGNQSGLVNHCPTDSDVPQGNQDDKERHWTSWGA